MFKIGGVQGEYENDNGEICENLIYINKVSAFFTMILRVRSIIAPDALFNAHLPFSSQSRRLLSKNKYIFAGENRFYECMV